MLIHPLPLAADQLFPAVHMAFGGRVSPGDDPSPEPEPGGKPPGPGVWKGSERELSEIKLKKGEPIDRALRRLKKKADREGTLKEVRSHRHFEKPSEHRRRKLKVARFSAMLAARYADV